jgi:hypothetical protein
MVGTSSGTLCGVASPSMKVFGRGKKFTALRYNYCSTKSMTDIYFGYTGRKEF